MFFYIIYYFLSALLSCFGNNRACALANTCCLQNTVFADILEHSSFCLEAQRTLEVGRRLYVLLYVLCINRYMFYTGCYARGEANSLLRSLMSGNANSSLDESVSSFSPRLLDNGRSVILMREEVLWPPNEVLANRTNIQQQPKQQQQVVVSNNIL